MKLYSYATGKLYESEGSFMITISEKALGGDAVAAGDVTIDEKYVSMEEAIDNAYDIMKEIAANEGVSEDDIECVEENGCLVCTAPGYKEWKFCINGDVENAPAPAQNEETSVEECGDAAVSECGDGAPCESVASRFSKYREMFESNIVIEDDGKHTDINEEEKEDDSAEEDDKKSEKPEGDDGDEKKEEDDKKDGDDEGDEDEEMKAILITVKKGDEDACKEELIDAGIAEEDIEIIEGDEDAENIDIRIEPSAALELKDYLAGKGIDLEEKIGGEIVDASDEEGDDKKDGEDGDGEGECDGEPDDFDFDNIGDIFGAED